MPSGRLRKPASLKKGKSESKEHLDKRAKLEEQMSGSDDLLYEIPEQLNELGGFYYKFIINELSYTGILGNLDIPIITQTADMLARVEELTEIINETGLLVVATDRNGSQYTKPNPAVKMRQDFLKQLSAFYTQLGMTPSARATLAEIKMGEKEEAQDPLMQALGQARHSDDYDDE